MNTDTIERHDFSTRLLKAVTDVQSSWISGRSVGDVFEDLLEQVLLLTESEYGYIGEVRTDANGKAYLLAYALTDISWDDPSRALVAKARHGGGFPFRDHDTLYGQVLVTGRPVIANDAPNDPRSGGTAPGHLPLDRYLGIPLWSEGELVGSVGVSNRPGGYDDALVEALEPLTASCATIIRSLRGRRALETSSRTLEDLASTLRESLLPPELPTVAGLDLAARFRPASDGAGVLGDFYDVFSSGGVRWTFIIGDVRGHGPCAARTTALSRWSLQSGSSFVPDPSDLLLHLNARLLSRPEPNSPFVSAIGLVVEAGDIVQGEPLTVRMASAGHPPPIIRRADGSTVLLEPHGTVLGVVADPGLTTRQVVLEPGDAMILFTDGVSEAHHGDLRRGERELQEALAGAFDDADAMADACMAVGHQPGPDQLHADDSAVLVLRVPG